MKTTLKDIAKETSLSISTVSRVLRGETSPHNKNTDIVLQAAKELNYEADTIKTGGNSRKSNRKRIAIVTKPMTGEFYADFFNGFVVTAEKTDIDITLVNRQEEIEPLTEYLATLPDEFYDAAILFYPKLKPNQYLKILKVLPDDFPIISLASVVNPVIDTTTFDSYRGGYIVAEHFHQLGYKKVGIITGPVKWTEPFLRRNGFVDYAKFRSPMELGWECEGDYNIDSGKKAFSQFKKLDDRPGAVFVSNDYMALGFMIDAMNAGFKVPDDIAICGYDDLEISENFSPSLTSVHTDFKLLAENVYRMIEERWSTKSPNNGLLNLLPVSLKIRNSTRPAK